MKKKLYQLIDMKMNEDEINLMAEIMGSEFLDFEAYFDPDFEEIVFRKKQVKSRGLK